MFSAQLRCWINKSQYPGPKQRFKCAEHDDAPGNPLKILFGPLFPGREQFGQVIPC